MSIKNEHLSIDEDQKVSLYIYRDSEWLSEKCKDIEIKISPPTINL